MRLRSRSTVLIAMIALLGFASIANAQNPRTLPADTSPATADIMTTWKDSPVATKHITLGTLKTFFSADSVPLTRTITCTPPLLCDGGASMTLAANRTLSIPGVTRWFNVKDSPYSALGNNANDDTAAINAAIAAAGVAGGGVVYFPPGAYKTTSAIVVDKTDVWLVGDGSISTRINSFSATGNIVTFGASPTINAGGMMNMAVTSAVTRTSGASILISGAGAGHIENVRIQTDGGDGIVFGTGDSSMWWVSDGYVITAGAFSGLKLLSGNDRFISDFWFQGNQAVGSRSIDIRHSGGDWFTNVEAVLSEYGVLVNPDTGQNVFAVHMLNVLADSNTTNGFRFVLSGTGTINSFNCTACWTSNNGAASASGRGVYISGGTGYIFTSMRNQLNGGHGFEIAGGTNVRIIGGYFTGNSAASSNIHDGIAVTAAASRWSVVGAVSGQFSNLPNSQKYGISVVAGADNYYVVGNELTQNVTGSMNNIPGLSATRIATGNLPLMVANEAYVTTLGMPAGQTINGGTSASETLKLVSTSHATKGEVQVTANTTALPSHAATGTVFHVGGGDGAAARSLLDGFASVASIDFRRANTSAASPSALATAENIGQIGWFGRGSTAYTSTARSAVRAITSEAWTDTAQGAYLSFQVTATGTASAVEGLKVESNKVTTLGTITELGTCTPASASAACVAGDHCWDTNFEYRCVATNTWKRTALSTW